MSLSIPLRANPRTRDSPHFKSHRKLDHTLLGYQIARFIIIIFVEKSAVIEYTFPYNQELIMDYTPNQTTVLDVTKGLGFGFLYHPVIGAKRREKRIPLITRLPILRPKKIKKVL